ncbi:hypothetical protein BH10ACI3_BH10ACI3_29250 [soil metagenome]
MQKTRLLFSTAMFVVLAIGVVSAQTTAFNYHGSLKDGANEANGNYDFEFALFDAVSGGAQLGSTLTRSTVVVANGIFSVSLDFGSQFPGGNRFLEIRLRPTGNPSGFQQLLPRQQVNSSPYSVKSLNSDNATTATNATNAATATNALNLGGVAANQYVVTTDPRMTDPRPPTAGSSNYVQNTTSPQATSNFNISGNGTAGGTLSGGIVNATSRYNIGGNRVLSNAGSNNLFAGVGAGSANPTGVFNSFFGSNAGQVNTLGNANSFFGAFAGDSNIGGTDNSFFGVSAGQSNTGGNNNSFFGRSAGFVNTASDNSFFGTSAGQANTGGNNNSFFGKDAGFSNTTGSNNSFVGTNAGNTNTMGSSNTVIGSNANVVSGNLSFATAIGAGVVVNQSNSVVVGRNVDDVIVNGALISNGIFLFKYNTGAAGTNSVCASAPPLAQLLPCVSSLRYKTNIASFDPGLDLVKQLRPITFDWKQGGMHDFGLAAEEVAAVEPLLATYDENGVIMGVKYDRIGVVLINAVGEQQAQIDAQKAVIAGQQTEIDMLKAFICSQSPTAAFCKPKN